VQAHRRPWSSWRARGKRQDCGMAGAVTLCEVTPIRAAKAASCVSTANVSCSWRSLRALWPHLQAERAMVAIKGLQIETEAALAPLGPFLLIMTNRFVLTKAEPPNSHALFAGISRRVAWPASCIGSRWQARSAQKSGARMERVVAVQQGAPAVVFVSDEKGLYHDFSSGKHGDIFTFTMEMEGLTFPEVVERLTALAGLAMPH
jgi:hypothetical protein